MTREQLIISFYEENKIPLIIRIIDYIKGDKKNEQHNTKLDTSGNDSISNDSDINTWNSEVNKIFNNKEII